MKRHRRRKWGVIGHAILSVIPATALAQTSLTGSSIGIKSNSSETLSANGYLGTYLVVPAGGATVNFTVNATAEAGATTAPHMNLVIADSISGFTVGNTSATNYTTSNIALPAGTYFVRNERDYSSNVGVSRSFTVNNLLVNTLSGSAATFANTNSNSNALAASNTYIDNFRKGPATVALSGPGNIPLLKGTPVQADLARHAFNFGGNVPGNSLANVNTYLADNPSPGTTAYNFQNFVNSRFNVLVPSNAGKWSNNEGARDVVNMSGPDKVLNYAQSHNMRSRMHNLIWGDNSFNGQQPSWVLNDSNTGLLDQALNASLTQAQRDAAKADLRAEITERIQYYASATRANQWSEVDVYNESIHTPAYWNAYGASGIAGIYSEVAQAIANAGSSARVYTNEYNVFHWGDAYGNWYRTHVEDIRKAGGTVSGIGTQYYVETSSNANTNSPRSAARIMSVLQGLAVEGLPITLTEYGQQSGGTGTNAHSTDPNLHADIIEESLRMFFGNPQVNGFLIWGWWAGATDNLGGNSVLADNAWNLTTVGQRWQNVMSQWDTNVPTFVNADGTIAFTGFYGDYYLRGQTSGPYDMALLKGTSNYNLNMAAPPAWSLWNTGNSGTWSTPGNWTTGGSANAAGQTAYFGSSALARTVTVDSAKTVGMLAFNSFASYTLSGAGTITLQGFANGSGGVAAIYVAAGTHTISAPLALADDATITVAPSSTTLTVSNLLSSPVTITKTGSGTLRANNIRAGGLVINAGIVQVQPGGASSGMSVVDELSIAPGAALDLADNDLAVNNISLASMKALVLSGLAGPAGITSSTSDGSQILALFDNALVGASDWQGVAIGANAIVGKYTYFGDVNIDGQVTGDDYTVIDSNLNTTPPAGVAWLRGDANTDGNVTGDDYTVVDSNLGLGVGNPLAPALLVPEPSTIAVIAAAGMLLRRFRSRLPASAGSHD